jgi:hypothetical protein
MCFPRLYRFGLISLWLLYAACRNRNHRLDEMGAPVTQQQQIVAGQATERLREQWNRKACPAIYEQAAPFFRSQSLAEWLSQCEYFQPQWGIWQEFVLQEATTCGGLGKDTVCLLGMASLGTGRYEVIIGWALKTQQAKLLYWSLAQNDRSIQIMPYPTKKLFHPPFRQDRQHRDG